MGVCSEAGIPSEECQVFPGAQAHPRTQHVGACSLVKSFLVMHTLMCVPSLEAVQQRTHELRPWGLGSNLAVTSVRYGSCHKARLLLRLCWGCLNWKGRLLIQQHKAALPGASANPLAQRGSPYQLLPLPPWRSVCCGQRHRLE